MNDQLVGNFFRLGKVASDVLDDLINPDNWLDGGVAPGIALWDLALGRGRVIDPEATRSVMRYNWQKKKGMLDSLIKRLEEQGNKSGANSVRAMKYSWILELGQ